MIKVGLLKADKYDKYLKDKINHAVELVGGFGSVVKSGDRVLLKPNFLVAKAVETATNTHPDFIAAVVEILSDYNCKIAIGDSPMFGTAYGVVKKLGLDQKLKKYDVEYLEFKENKPVSQQEDGLKPRKYRDLCTATVLQEFDRIINLPKLKTHAQMGITLATKNLFGCVAGKVKLKWHMVAGSIHNFARLLVEVSQTVNPDLNILDGIIGMDGNGPANGRPRKTKVILAGKNCIALDRVVVELIGKNPSRFPIFKAADDLSIPGTRLEDICILGDSIEECRIKGFKVISIFPADFIGVHFLGLPFKPLFDQRMVVKHKNCIMCGRCIEHCLSKAIRKEDGIVIDHDKCIKCCCCQEGCPTNAIHIYTPPLGTLVNKIRSGRSR
ncbi:MAG TPA: DUF362 domain-containing protein [Clostridiales bacterium]|nr:DUF362 domain-containing protein [Clostridiales bacterium]